MPKLEKEFTKAIIIFVVFLFSIFLFTNVLQAEEIRLENGVIPYGIFKRVFQFKFGKNQGTCFAFDVGGKQYIITARHLAPNVKNGDSIEIYQNNDWQKISVIPIFPELEKTDIVALAPDRLIASSMDIDETYGKIAIGQDVFFLGFPFELYTKSNKPSDFKIAFVKKAILSAMDLTKGSGNIFYLDGHNNPGFSGGPVIFANKYENNHLQIAGVISGYRNQPVEVKEAIIEQNNTKTNTSTEKVIHYILENTGIVVAYNFAEILKAIKQKPVGYPLNQQNK